MKYILLTFLFVVTACEENASEPARFSVGNLESTSKSFVIPKILKPEIDKRYLESFRKSFEKDLRTDAEILQAVPRDFLDIVLSLWQSREGTIRDNYKYTMLRGGGAVDLGKIIIGNKGSIFFKFELNKSGQTEEKLDQYRVYFLSQAIPKVIDGETYGSKCGDIIDITDRVLESGRGQPLRANITQERHVPAMTGLYYFVHFSGEIIYLAAMSLEDSRFPKMKCK
jgi:hypothetical protein